MTTAALYAPPGPPVPRGELSLSGFLRAIRTNALTMWPDAAYEQEVRTRRLFGRTYMLLNSPAAIHRVLVENHTNYRRSPASCGRSPVRGCC
jgi:unspecific monooxygenase